MPSRYFCRFIVNDRENSRPKYINGLLLPAMYALAGTNELYGKTNKQVDFICKVHQSVTFLTEFSQILCYHNSFFIDFQQM